MIHPKLATSANSESQFLWEVLSYLTVITAKLYNNIIANFMLVVDFKLDKSHIF